MSDCYVIRAQREGNTILWNNNPTPEEALKSKSYNVIGATTNPTYISKMLRRDNEKAFILNTIDSFLDCEKSGVIYEKLQAALVKRLCGVFMDDFIKSGGTRGFVAVQGNPYHDGDADYMIMEALRNFEIAPNIIVKLPGTSAALTAFKYLTSRGYNLIMTSGLSFSQAEAFFEIYTRVHGQGSKKPKFLATTLAGILDDYCKNYAAKNNVDISAEALGEAGCQFSKLGYAVWKERGYAGKLQGGGCRSLKHYTEMLGADMEVTINYSYFDELNALNPPIERRIDKFAPAEIMDELNSKLPFYETACAPGALSPGEFDAFEPFVFFRAGFLKAVDTAVNVIEERLKL